MYSPEKKNPLIWALGRDHNIDFGIKNSSYCNFFFCQKEVPLYWPREEAKRL